MSRPTDLDALSALIAEHDLGPLEERLPLKAPLRVAGQTYAIAELCVGARGIWLLAKGSGSDLVVSLRDEHSLRYELGALRDQLEVLGAVVPLSGAARLKVRRGLALARLQQRSAAKRAIGPLPEGRHIQPASDVELELLGSLLAPDERLLGWLHTATVFPLHSPIAERAEGEVRLLVTDQRSVFVALGELGDVSEIATDKPLIVERRLARTQVHAPGCPVVSSTRNARLLYELAVLTSQNGVERTRECARLNFVSREPGAVAFARELLESARARSDARSRFALLSLLTETGAAAPSAADLSLALSELRTGGLPGTTLADLFIAWEFRWATGLALVSALRAQGTEAEPWALELHVAVRDARLLGDKNRSEAARTDIALAEHLIASHENARARKLLLARLAEMPSEALEDLLPPRDADLTAGAGGQALRIRVYELLAQAQGGPAGPDVAVLAELARLQPLVQNRMTALTERASGGLGARARATLALFQGPESQAPPQSATLNGELAPLSATSVDDVLAHPLVREGGALIGRLQALLASVPAPDHGVLRDYCERLSSSQNRVAARALGDAAKVLGVPNIEGYISRGAKAVGFRAYEGAPPFVLIGGKHIEGDSEYRLGEPALRFAIGAEVAHLRYGHTRVTSSEVWAGALSKGRQGLDLALGVLPALNGLKLAGRLQRIVAKVPANTMRGVLGSAIDYAERLALGDTARDGDEPVLSRLNEELVAAHRVMQLTADRAGLLLSGDIAAAMQAMLLARTDHRELARAFARDGLDAVLSRRNPDGRMAHQDLAVRIAALFAFYLSDEYERLRAEITAQSSS